MPKISIVINHYNPSINGRIEAMLLFAAECVSAYTSIDYEIIISDGSGLESAVIRERCEKMGWVYISTRHPVSFSDAYNRGISRSSGDYVTLMANDVFVCAGWDTIMIKEIERTGAWMAAPYLSNSDYPCQSYDFPYRRLTFHPSSMTFNLNAITRNCINKIGLMSEEYSGAYNDSDYLIRIRRAGGRVIILDAGRILHMGQASINSTPTMYRPLDDQEKFKTNYPEFSRRIGISWHNVCHDLLSDSVLFKIGIKIGDRIRPNRLRLEFLKVIYRMEPLLHKAN